MLYKIEQETAQFLESVSRIGILKKHIVKSKFHQKYTAKHQKGRSVPIKLQPRVTDELERLQKEGHIEKLLSCIDKNFFSPILITVKKLFNENSIRLFGF